MRWIIMILMVGMLAACGDDAQKGTEKHTENEPGHGTEEVLALPLRLAFMTGHVEAGLALYRAGEPAMAAPHLLHPVSETHAAEREGLDALGFDASLFEVVSAALDAGKPASEIEPQLAAAEANLAAVTQKAGGDPAEIIRFLMSTVLAEYEIGVSGTSVTDLGEYQDAFGFTVVALRHAEVFEGAGGEELRLELEALLNFWPEAPLPPETATPLYSIQAQVSRVIAALEKAEEI